MCYELLSVVATVSMFASVLSRDFAGCSCKDRSSIDPYSGFDLVEKKKDSPLPDYRVGGMHSESGCNKVISFYK